MPAKIIASYDGTANEDDAIALGYLLTRAGGELSLAYVRHTHDPDRDRETLAQHEAEELLERGAARLGPRDGRPAVALHVVTDRSTPEGLRELAESIGADVIGFCSDSHTARGHVSIGNSAERLLEGGGTAIAIAPVGFAERVLGGAGEVRLQRIVAVGEAGGDGSALATAQGLAAALGATVSPVANSEADLLVIDSRPEAEEGRISISSASAHLIDIATCPVLVVPRGVTLPFGLTAALSA